MAVTQFQLDALLELGSSKVSRQAIEAVLQVLSDKSDRLGIRDKPLKAPFHIELSPAMYRELAIKQLKAQRPDIDWEAVLPTVPKTEEKKHHIGAGPPDTTVFRMPMTITKDDYENLEESPTPDAAEGKRNKNEEDDFLDKKKKQQTMESRVEAFLQLNAIDAELLTVADLQHLVRALG